MKLSRNIIAILLVVSIAFSNTIFVNAAKVSDYKDSNAAVNVSTDLPALLNNE